MDLSKLKKKSLNINDTSSYFFIIQTTDNVSELMLNNISPHKHLIFYKNTILVL